MEEISFAIWNSGDLVEITASIVDFKNQLSAWTIKMVSHFYIKNVQRNAIKQEKQVIKSDTKHLVIHIDFAENWAIF